jgi:hypothetical protein
MRRRDPEISEARGERNANLLIPRLRATFLNGKSLAPLPSLLLVFPLVGLLVWQARHLKDNHTPAFPFFFLWIISFVLSPFICPL